MAESSRRLVVIGRKYPAHSTRHILYSNREPLWHPIYRAWPEGAVDEDDLRKRRLETRDFDERRDA